MNLKLACMTCVHWHVCDRCDGWCTLLNKLTEDNDHCKKHVPVKIEPIEESKESPQPGTITLSGSGASRWKEIYQMRPPPEGVELS
jgi:hypothetical protein